MQADWRQIADKASRLMILASIAAFTAIVLLLFQSTFWSDRVSPRMQAMGSEKRGSRCTSR